MLYMLYMFIADFILFNIMVTEQFGLSNATCLVVFMAFTQFLDNISSLFSWESCIAVPVIQY